MPTRDDQPHRHAILLGKIAFAHDLGMRFTNNVAHQLAHGESPDGASLVVAVSAIIDLLADLDMHDAPVELTRLWRLVSDQAHSDCEAYRAFAAGDVDAAARHLASSCEDAHLVRLAAERLQFLP